MPSDKRLGRYDSPLGLMVLEETNGALSGAWFEGQRYFTPPEDLLFCTSPLLQQAFQWLDVYFEGHDPGECPPLCPEGSPFRRLIWNELRLIPYGKVTTYGLLAAKAAQQLGKPRMSAQAVGGAVGHNPLSVFIPCHRVIGTDGSLTGYAGGLEKKTALLQLEKADLTRLYIP